MSGPDTHADFHVGPIGDERLENGPVGPGHLVSHCPSLRRAGKRGRIGGGAGVGSMDGEDAEMRQEQHRPAGDENDDCVQGQ
jgi:hypothetical protein